VSIALDIKYKLSAENLLDGRKTLILVHTKTNLINLMKEIKNHQNLFNKKPKVWYTNNCGSKNQYDIVVNPIIEQIDFDGYEKVVLYDPLWSRSEYDLIKKKVDTLYWVEKSDVIHRDEIKSLIPDRQDFAVLYRHIKLLESLNIRSVYLDHLLEECNKAAKMNEFKILLCMDVFKELGLMYYNFDHDHIFFQVLSNKKVSLEDSKVLQKMIRWGKIFEENQRGK
jgi:hypothetical protein